MLSLFSVANAQSAPANVGGGSFDPMSLLPFVFIIVIFYFLIFRPQQKRMKQQKEMLSSLRRGDKVLTSGGILGTIERVDNDKELHVEIASGVVVRLNRGSVSEVLSKPGAMATSASAEKVAPKPMLKVVAKPVAKAKVAAKPAAKKAVVKKPAVAKKAAPKAAPKKK